MIIAIDTETTGLDFYHGCKPFDVTIARDDQTVLNFEWRVDPKTRQPKVIKSELREIQEEIENASAIWMHNAKFDVTALEMIGIKRFPWDKLRDSMLAGHVLSNHTSHSLKNMAWQWTKNDIAEYEDILAEVANEARRKAQKHFPKWKIAQKKADFLPSAEGEVWKSDYWLAREIAHKLKGKKPHWKTVLSEYADEDSKATLILGLEVEKQLKERDLWKIFLEKMKLSPIAQRMERRGMTISLSRTKKIVGEYQKELGKIDTDCKKVAKKYNYSLNLPNGAPKPLASPVTNDWRRDSIDYVAEQSRVAAIADARRRADEAERIAAETRATVIVKEKVVTNDIIKYFKDPNRTVCEYDAERVHIKTEILRTADPRSHAVD